MIDAAELRARLAAPGRGPRESTADGVGDPAEPRPLVAAAVLVPLVLGATPGVLLTKRAAHLSSHAGQVSFPGGRIDPDDADAEGAALREAEEEIGLARAQVTVVGRLSDYATGTGYRITPIVGLLPAGIGLESLRLQLSAGEVDQVFELPLAVLLDPAAPRQQSVRVRGVTRQFWVWPHPEHYIWGATAAILLNLAARLRGG
jgi:8-oxo-dGTP pyrophosphatase MutT (NUDIX family)